MCTPSSFSRHQAFPRCDCHRPRRHHHILQQHDHHPTRLRCQVHALLELHSSKQATLRMIREKSTVLGAILKEFEATEDWSLTR